MCYILAKNPKIPRPVINLSKHSPLKSDTSRALCSTNFTSTLVIAYSATSLSLSTKSPRSLLTLRKNFREIRKPDIRLKSFPSPRRIPGDPITRKVSLPYRTRSLIDSQSIKPREMNISRVIGYTRNPI